MTTTQNQAPVEGVTRCWCGSKYWDEHFDCGLPASETIVRASHGGLDLGPIVYRCHSCGDTYRTGSRSR